MVMLMPRITSMSLPVYVKRMSRSSTVLGACSSGGACSE